MSIMEGVPKSIARIGRETTIILFVVQSLTSASAIATSTVLSILGEQLSGNAAWSGVSAAMIQMAATPFAYFWSTAWDCLSRRLCCMPFTTSLFRASMISSPVKPLSPHTSPERLALAWH